MVLLHYVGYGYAKRGCPIWLVKGLENCLLEYPNLRLMVIFHELFAFGLPWQSSFWTSLYQRWLSAKLAKLASACCASWRQSAEWLGEKAPKHRGRVACSPVFSNVGEASQLPGFERRHPHLVVFGGVATRSRAYAWNIERMEHALKELQISQIVDIGPPCSTPPKMSIPIVFRGCLPANKVSAEMSISRFGYFNCPIDCLSKSGVFAAYAAHGLVPLCSQRNAKPNFEGLESGVHLLNLENALARELPQVETVAGNVRTWYATHSLERQTARLCALMEFHRGPGS